MSCGRQHSPSPELTARARHDALAPETLNEHLVEVNEQHDLSLGGSQSQRTMLTGPHFLALRVHTQG